MRRLLLPCLVLVLAGLVRAALPFPQAGSDLPPDPAARFGTLPNGLRYVIRPNAEPRERASLRLLVEAGAIHETEEQRGLAHFLEHLAFSGSTHYPPGTLIQFFQRMGMNFGGDTNANTGFDRTVYLLELPDTRPATIAEGCQVLADYAGGLLLRPEDIEKERGIILSEKRTRDSVGYRTFVAQLAFGYAGTRLPDRLPIGTEEVIRTADRARFQDFYDTWYRPERMSVVVVGDLDPAAVEAQLAQAFSGLAARAPARPEPAWGIPADRSGTVAFFHPEAEAPNTTVSIGLIQAHAAEPDTAAGRVRDLPRELAHAIINRRLAELAKREGAPFLGGGASAGESFNRFREARISLACRGDQWEAALGVADQELRRALAHGFQPAELREVVATYRNGLEQAVKTATTRRSDGLADEITESLLARDVFTSPESDLALLGPALERVTTDDCLAALRRAWEAPHRLVAVTGNAALPGAADAAAARGRIAEAYARSQTVKVDPPAAIADLPWAYTDFGPPGKVTRREHVGDLDVTLITFANGVRLNLKRTDFERNRIRLTARIGHGALLEPRDQPGLAYYAGQTYNEGGLGRHSADDLRRILAGRTVGAALGVGADAFTVAGGCSREDLRRQLELVTARITDPGFRPEADRQARKAIEQMYLGFAHTAAGPFNLEVAQLLASGDPRFGLPPKEQLLQRTLAEVRAWITPELRTGPLEVALVGDLDVETAIAEVARTLGALPARGPRQALGEQRRVAFPREPFTRDYAIPTEIPKGQVALYWPTTDGRDIRRARRLNLLAEVLADRLRVKVREELGDAYSPGAGSTAGDVYPDYGYIQASVVTDPPRAARVAEVIRGLAAELAARGVTEDELARARQPVLTSLRESARTNAYWLGAVLARAQERPEALDWCRTRYADNESITAADLTALAAQYLGAERASRVIVVPAPGTGGRER